MEVTNNINNNVEDSHHSMVMDDMVSIMLSPCLPHTALAQVAGLCTLNNLNGQQSAMAVDTVLYILGYYHDFEAD